MKLTVTFFIVFSTLLCNAHQDRQVNLNRNNIHFEYLWHNEELDDQFNILLELADALLDSFKDQNYSIHLSFEYAYNEADSIYTTVGYGDFSYRDYSKKESTEFHEEGLIIKIKGHEFNVKSILNLIANSVQNIDYIKSNLKEHKFSSIYSVDFFIESIPLDSVKSFTLNTNKDVEKLTQLKIYKNILPSTDPETIDYYFHNNTYHFYKTSKKQKEQSGKSDEEIVLSLEKLKEIVETDRTGYFIFSNDSTFYCVPWSMDTIFGPTTIKGLKDGRVPILRPPTFHSEPISRFIIPINTSYMSSTEKVLYIPDSSLVISHFEAYENNLILGLINNKKREKPIKQKRESQNILSILLILSIVINLILILKRKTKA